MKFIYPSFLWALFLLLIPIIIHFVNFRRHQTVYFSNVELLKRVRKETKRMSKLKQLIILACRIIVLGTLIIAFAKPYRPIAGIELHHADNVVCVYIDNSFSMNAETDEGFAIDKAKSKALSIVNAEKMGSQFALFTNDLGERQHRLYSQREIVDLIGEVQISHNQANLSLIYLRMENLLDRVGKTADRKIYFISDYQRYSTDLEFVAGDSSIVYNFVPLKGNVPSNLSIDTCWFETPAHFPEQVENLSVQITNRGSVDFPQVPVNVYLNDTLKALSNIKLDAKESVVLQLPFSNSKVPVVHGRIEVSDYPIVYDNVLYFDYAVEDQKSVLALSDRTNLKKKVDRLRALFMDDDFIKIDVEELERFQVSKLPDYDCVILSELNQLSTGFSDALASYVADGGTLIVVPQVSDGSFSIYDPLVSSLSLGTVAAFDTSNISFDNGLYDCELYKNVFREKSDHVDLPTIHKRFRFDFGTDAKPLINFADGLPALNNVKHGNGDVYFFAFQALSGDGNNFAQHLLFVPTFYNLALKASFNPDLYNVLGIDRSVMVKNTLETTVREIVMRHLQSNVEVVASVKQHEGNVLGLYPGGDLLAGNYDILMNGQFVAGTAYNYNLRESELDFYSKEELTRFFEQSGLDNVNVLDVEKGRFEVALAGLDSGRHFWKWFIFVALFFVVAEALVIKLWP